MAQYIAPYVNRFLTHSAHINEMSGNAGGRSPCSRLHATLKVLQWYVAGMTVNFSRQELSGSRFVELVQLTASGRYLH